MLLPRPGGEDLGQVLRALRPAGAGGQGLTPRDLLKALHRTPEVSGREEATAARVKKHLERTGPDLLLSGLGGHGVAALFQGPEPGPKVMVRCELDALPLPESPGAYHGCGHDGHMAILLEVARRLGEKPPGRGSVLLLFQPEEETGTGARAVLDDPAFRRVTPDCAVALHNLPGYPLGVVLVRSGVFAAASTGLTFRLTGIRSHAGEPHKGRNPAMAAAALVQALGGTPQESTGLFQPGKVTVTHVRVGTRAFGTSPGDAVVMATLRAEDPQVLEHLLDACRRNARGIARAWNLRLSVRIEEPFPPVLNHSGMVQRVRASGERRGLAVHRVPEPFPWSEDFGHFTRAMPGVLFGLGAGEDSPPLHHPAYRFPPALLDTGADLLEDLARNLLSDGVS